MPSPLYQNAATLSGLAVWYGLLVLLGSPGGRGWRWLRALVPLAAGGLSFRAVGWYLGAVHPVLLPWLEHLSGGRALVRFIQDVGLREELIKLLCTLPCLLWLPPRPAAPREALLTAALVGLGFATAENRWFFGGHAEPTLLVGRVFSTTALHMAATALCGAALVQAIRSRPGGWARFCAVFFSVVVAHGLYDWAPTSAWTWLRAGGTSWLSQAVVIALLACFFHSLSRLPPGPQTTAPGTDAYLLSREPLHTYKPLFWFILGAIMQNTLALGLTWLRWGTPDALWICARECLLFLPATAATAWFVVTNSSRRQNHDR